MEGYDESDILRGESMGKGLASIVLGGFLSLLGGYYAGKAGAEEQKKLSCAEQFSRLKETKIKDYDQLCKQLEVGEEARRACSSLLWRLKGKMHQSYPDLPALADNPIEDDKKKGGDYLCKTIKGEKYKNDCTTLFSQMEGAFVHDCEFRGMLGKVNERESSPAAAGGAEGTNVSSFVMNYNAFCSYFSTEAMKSQCESDFREGIEAYCLALSPPEKKQYQDRVIENFFNLKKPRPLESELQEIVTSTCRDDLSLESARKLLSLRNSSGQPIYEQKLSGIVTTLAQKSNKEEKNSSAVCRQIIRNTKIEHLCKQTRESDQECQRLERDGRLDKAGFSKTLEQHCTGLGKKFEELTLHNLRRGYGKADERFPTKEAQAAEIKVNVENDCYDNFNMERKIDYCMLLLPQEVTLDDLAGKGEIPYFITELEALPRPESNSSSSPSWNVAAFVRSLEVPSLHLVASDFSRLAIVPSRAVREERGVYYFNIIPSADNLRSNRVNVYELVVQASNHNGTSAPAKLTVVYDARGKINSRELIHSNTAVVWRLTKASYAHGVRTDTISTPLPGHPVLSSLKLIFRGEGGLRRIVNEYKVENEMSQELYGEFRLGVGMSYDTGFRKYSVLFEVGAGYSESSNLHPTSQWYAALRGNELLGRDFEYNILFQRSTQKLLDGTTSWDSLEARMATLFSKQKQGWGLVAGGKIEDLANPRRYELALGVKYRLPQTGGLDNVELELRGLLEHHLKSIPAWRLKKHVEKAGEGFAPGGMFSVNFEFP